MAADFANLAEFLIAYPGVVERLDDVSGLGSLAGEVKISAIQGLLLARAPGIFEDETDPAVVDVELLERFVRYYELLNGIATEVEGIVGLDPVDAQVRKYAVWTITVGTAAEIESSLYDTTDGRESTLRTKYLALIKKLQGTPGANGEGALAVPAPLGSFPPPEPEYLDLPFHGTYGPGRYFTGW